MAGRDGDRLREGEWDEMEGLGLTDGEMDGERLFTRGEPGRSGGEGGGGSVMKSGGRRASLKDLWKKFSTLLLRIIVLKDSERLSFCSCVDREREKEGLDKTIKNSAPHLGVITNVQQALRTK